MSVSSIIVIAIVVGAIINLGAALHFAYLVRKASLDE